jgi:tetratricopeptide (TPR) repeat protein
MPHQTGETFGTGGWLNREGVVRGFEDALLRGERPPLEDYVSGISGADRTTLLAELVHVELECRLKAGEPARVEEYLVRFPELGANPAGVIGLARAEFRLRRRTECELTPDEYVRRFPQFAADVTPALDDTTADAASGAVATSPRIDGYELGREVGRGGMGVVYLARDTALGRDVAVKVLRDSDPAASARFVAEACITGRLQHPGIPPVHAVGTLSDDRPFLAMKLIRGRTLAELIRDGEDRSRLVTAFEQVCQAVGFAHSQEVIHRDLKPANVMVGTFGEVQVMDWGLARETATRSQESGDTNDTPRVAATRSGASEQTQPGTVMGTPAFMAPEQARGETVDCRADVFGLGAMLCSILTGKPPYTGTDVRSVHARAIAADLAEALARLDECGAEAELVALAKRCLSAEPAARPADGGEVATAVAGFRAAAEERARQAEVERAKAEVRVAEQRRKRRWQLVAAAAVGVIALGGLGFAWWQDSEATRQQFEQAERDRVERERLGRNAEGVERLTAESETALRADNTVAAATALGRAANLATEGGADHLADRLDRCRANLTMLRELNGIDDALWFIGDGRVPSLERAMQQWAAAFARFGITPGITLQQDAAARINDSPIRDRLLSAADFWLSAGGPGELEAILNAADPDTYRGAFRSAARALDVNRAAALAGQSELLTQPPRFAVVLAGMKGVTPDQRRQLLEAVSRGRPDHYAVLMTFGAQYPPNRRQGADNRAMHYRAAVALRPDSAAAWNNLGIAQRDRGEFELAAECFRTALRHAPEYDWAHNNLGVALRDLGKLDPAADALQEAIRLDPANPKFRDNLGLVFLAKRDWTAAASAYREMIRLSKDDPHGHYNLAVALQNLGEIGPAIAEYREVIRLDSKDFKARSNLSGLLIDQKPAEAIALLREAVKNAPGEARMHYNLGFALAQTGDPKGAVAAFQDAVRLAPTDAVTRYQLGTLHFQQKQFKEAEAEFLKVTRLQPNNVNAYINLGVARAGQKNMAGAIEPLRKAIELGAKGGAVHRNLGVALSATGDREGAIAAFRKSLEIEPNHAAARNTLNNLEKQKADRDARTAPPPRPAGSK